MIIVLTLIGVGVVLLAAEGLAKFTRLHAEITRKFVHMFVGTFVAFWPFFLSWRTIEILSIAFFVGILLSVKYTIFKAIHLVPRKAVGELLFAVVIGLLALVSANKWVFLVAMLNLSIGDALAAVIGLLLGSSNKYKVFGMTKSIAGTSAFFLTSIVTMIIYEQIGHLYVGPATFWLVPIIATATENVAVLGTDNLIMPLLIAVVLRWL